MDESVINTLDIPVLETKNQEEIELKESGLSPKMTEDEFARVVKLKLDEATRYWSKLNIAARQDTNFKYWLGDQVNKTQLRDDEESWVENAIFRNIETFIPIVTSRTPEQSATPAYKNDRTRAYALDVRRITQAEWEVYQMMQPILTRGIRNHLMNLLGVFKLGYDPDTNTYWTEEIPANEIVVSKKGDFIGHYIKDKTLGDLLDMFPDKEAELRRHASLGPGIELNEQYRGSPVEYLEAWTDEVVGWKIGDFVLGVDNNPHYDYKGTDFVLGQDAMGQPISQNVKFNHFKAPKKPFLFLTYWNRGVHVFDDTTLLEQGIGPQNWINTRKRQIGLNANTTNGHWVSSGDFISQEEFEKIEGAIDEKIWLENGKPEDGLMKITGQPLPDYIYTDLLDSRAALDNIMGTHSTTRGEKSNNDTLGQDVLQKQADFGRVDGYVRDAVERFAQQWYEYVYHMMLVYGTEERAIAIPEDDDFESENVVFSRDQVPLIKKKDGTLIPVPLIIRVKQGSTLPEDEATKYVIADKMKDIVSPLDYLKMLGRPNPRELYKNFLIHQTDPFYLLKDDPDIQMMMAKKKAEADAAQQAVMEKEQLKAQTTVTTAQIKQQQSKSPAPAPPGTTPPAESGQANGKTSAQGVANAMRDMIDKGEVPKEALTQMLSA